MVLLPFKFFKYALDKNDLFIRYKKYEKSLCKVLINRLRTKFLLNCKKSDIVPKFLRFRIPQNGCFNEKSVHDFQMKLLHQEIFFFFR